MSAKSAWWIVGLLWILMFIALLGPGAPAWARPGQPAQTVPTPTSTPVLTPAIFLPLISVRWSASPPPLENQLFLPLVIKP